MQRRAVTCPNRRCQPAWCRGHHRRARPVHCALPYPLTDRDLMPSPAATGAGVSRQRTHPQSLRAVSTGARARPAPVRRWTGRLGRRRTALGRRRRPPWECAAVRQPGSAGRRHAAGCWWSAARQGRSRGRSAGTSVRRLPAVRRWWHGARSLLA